jgi:hypothetical protein
MTSAVLAPSASATRMRTSARLDCRAPTIAAIISLEASFRPRSTSDRYWGEMPARAAVSSRRSPRTSRISRSWMPSARRHSSSMVRVALVFVSSGGSLMNPVNQGARRLHPKSAQSRTRVLTEVLSCKRQLGRRDASPVVVVVTTRDETAGWSCRKSGCVVLRIWVEAIANAAIDQHGGSIELVLTTKDRVSRKVSGAIDAWGSAAPAIFQIAGLSAMTARNRLDPERPPMWSAP